MCFNAIHENKILTIISKFTVKAQHFNTGLGLQEQCQDLHKIPKFEDLSRHKSDFPVLYKAGLIFKDFSRKPSIFK